MVVESFSWPNLNERMFCRSWGSNPRPSAYQADAHPMELPRPTVTVHVCTEGHKPSVVGKDPVRKVFLENHNDYTYINTRQILAADYLSWKKRTFIYNLDLENCHSEWKQTYLLVIHYNNRTRLIQVFCRWHVACIVPIVNGTRNQQITCRRQLRNKYNPIHLWDFLPVCTNSSVKWRVCNNILQTSKRVRAHRCLRSAYV